MAQSKQRALDVDADDDFQRKEWFIQRIGWILWAVILAVAFAGLIGSGPLSGGVAQAPDQSLEVAFSRFAHYHQPISLEVVVRSPAEGHPLQLKVGREFLDAIKIDRFQPEPERSRVTADGAIYEFALDTQGGAKKIVVFLEFEKFGKVQGVMQIVGQQPVTFGQFVYP